jgi:hypothetical protein
MIKYILLWTIPENINNCIMHLNILPQTIKLFIVTILACCLPAMAQVQPGLTPQVLSPVSSTVWVSGNPTTISWNPAETHLSPVNAQLVNIWLSLDNGLSFNIPLATQTANDGNHDLKVPAHPSSQARIKIEAVNQAFSILNSGTFTIMQPQGVVAAPVISPGTSSFSTAVNVSISCSTPGALIYYTTNGNLPKPGTGFTKVYQGPFAVISTTTIRAMALRQFFNHSPVALSVLTQNGGLPRVSTPVITPGSGTFSGPQMVAISSSTPNSTIYYTTNGNVPSIGTNFTRTYTGPFFMPGTGTVRAMAVKADMANSAIAVANLNITAPAQVATPVISPGTSTHPGPVMVSIQTSTSGSSIFYTVNGNEPVPGTTFTRVYTGPFQVTASTTVRAMGRKSEMIQSLTSVSFINISSPLNPIVSTPQILPGTGTFSGPQLVSITCATPGATIYFTTSGNIPVIGTGFTKVYTGPFTVSQNTTVRAMAVKTLHSNSGVSVAFLTIQSAPARQAVSADQGSRSTLEVYPNPTRDKVKVRWSENLEDDLKISIFNTLGTEVSTYLVGKENQDFQVDFTGLGSGIYFIRTNIHPKLIRVIRQ